MRVHVCSQSNIKISVNNEINITFATKCLVTAMYISTSNSNFINIATTVVSHYSVNEVPKHLVQRT